MADTALAIKRLELKEKKRVRNYELVSKGMGIARDGFVTLWSSPALQLIGVMAIHQALYNKGLYNPRDPQSGYIDENDHSKGYKQDWNAGSTNATTIGVALLGGAMLGALGSSTGLIATLLGKGD